MAWSAVRLSSANQKKACKEEPSHQLVVGLITSGLLATSPDLAPSVRKRRHEITANQTGDLTEDDDLYDELMTSANEKKRRLTVEQVKFLEMSFKTDLKLEPERKALIAKKLGLRPRQVAIWFQNRRARWKNKQLEQDYEALKASYKALVQENETMVKKNEAIDEENKRLQEEVTQLTSMLTSRKVSCHVDARAVSLIFDSESDSDNSLEVREPPRSKLELVSPTNSVSHSGMLNALDLGHPASGEAIVAFVDQTSREINSLIACAAFKFEADNQQYSPSEDVFINLPEAINGFNPDDLLSNYEDFYYGFWWNGY